MLNLFLLGDTKIHYFQIFILWYLISFARFYTHKRSLIYLPHSPIYYFHFMENMKELNWLYQGHQQSNDKKPKSESFLFPNILKVGSCKQKNLYDERVLLGMRKRNLVSQCLEVWTSSKDKAFKYWAQINHYFKTGYFLHYILDLETRTNHKVQFYKICP